MLGRKDSLVGRALAWDAEDPDSIPCSTMDFLSYLRQITEPLCLSFSSEKWDDKASLPYRSPREEAAALG